MAESFHGGFRCNRILTRKRRLTFAAILLAGLLAMGRNCFAQARPTSQPTVDAPAEPAQIATALPKLHTAKHALADEKGDAEFQALVAASQPASDVISADLLIHPESVLSGQPAPKGEPALAVYIDHKPLSYDAPKILFQQSRGDAQCIAAAWYGADGKIVHQRQVFLMKPDYAVVVEHLYGTGTHAISRRFSIKGVSLSMFPPATRPAGAIAASDGSIMAAPIDAAMTMFIHGGVTDSQAMLLQKSLPTFVATVLVYTRPGEKVADVPKIVPVKAGNHMVYKFDAVYASGRVDHCGGAWESRLLHLGEEPCHGWAACNRIGPNGHKVIEMR